jgi:hypothetical protein
MKKNIPSRFSIEDKELKHRFEKRKRKRVISQERDSKYINLYLQEDKETEPIAYPVVYTVAYPVVSPVAYPVANSRLL